MSVYKRRYKKGDRWCVYITYPDGRRYRRTVGTKKEAEKVEQKLRSEMVAGRWDIHETEDVLFSDLIQEYFEYAQANNAASTSSIKIYRMEAHLVPYFGDMLLSRITPQMVDSYKTARIREGASPNTVNHELTNMSHMLKMAIRWGYIDRNILSSVERMKFPEKPRRFLSQEEIQILMESARDSHIYPIIVTAIHTGMRKSELFNLQYSDIDFSQGTITVQSKKDWHTKNYKSRTLQMTPVLQKLLADHRKKQAESGIQSGYVFTYKGEKIKYGIDETLGIVMEKAGLQGVTLHTFRHTFASQLVMAGVPLRDVQELMGHKSFETTLRYAHLSAEHVKRQVLRLPFANG